MVEDNVVQDWDSLGKEVRLIWENAKEYNQEGSEIYEMAEKLEVCACLDLPSHPYLVLRTIFSRYMTHFELCTLLLSHVPIRMKTIRAYR